MAPPDPVERPQNQSGGRGEYGQKADHGQNDEAPSDNGVREAI